MMAREEVKHVKNFYYVVVNAKGMCNNSSLILRFYKF